MKKIMLSVAAVLFAAGMTITAQTQGQAGPRFVDGNKDGKCDVCGREPGQGPGQGRCQGMRQGRGAARGQGMRAGQAGRRCGQCARQQAAPEQSNK